MHPRFLALAAAVVLTSGCGYNTIQQYDEQAAAAQGNIEVQLQRRADLIPNLVETVRGYAKQELDVLTNVTRARAGLVDAIKSGAPR
jgi:LemA protein